MSSGATDANAALQQISFCLLLFVRIIFSIRRGSFDQSQVETLCFICRLLPRCELFTASIFRSPLCSFRLVYLKGEIGWMARCFMCIYHKGFSGLAMTSHCAWRVGVYAKENKRGELVFYWLSWLGGTFLLIDNEFSCTWRVGGCAIYE